MKVFLTYLCIGFTSTVLIGSTLKAFIPFGATPDFIVGYYEGWDDAQALFAAAMVTIDDREAAEGFKLSKEQYRMLLRSAVGHVNPRSSKRVQKMLEGE
jgi:hypothetical protein